MQLAFGRNSYICLGPTIHCYVYRKPIYLFMFLFFQYVESALLFSTVLSHHSDMSVSPISAIRLLLTISMLPTRLCSGLYIDTFKYECVADVTTLI